MADGYNRVFLLGNLGANAELRYTQSGQPVLTLRLATTESYLDANKVRRERTEWHSVVMWGKRGEALARYLNKGTRVFVEGSLRTSSYEDKDGIKRYRTEVFASKIVFAGGPRQDGGSGSQGGYGGGYGPPQGGGYGGSRTGRQRAYGPHANEDFGPPPDDDFSDDIPF